LGWQRCLHETQQHSENKVFHGENYTLTVPLDQEDRDRRGTSYPVSPWKASRDAALERALPKVCPTRW
jgi:hypothetical protein